MEHLQESNGYMLYRNSEGFIEAYKKQGKHIVNGENIGTGLGHIVTNCKTIAEFEKLVSVTKKTPKSKLDDQPTLF